MRPYFVEATKQSPEVLLDREQSIIRVIGKSRPEDALLFYEPIYKWLNKYLENPNPSTKVVFKIEYFNSSSSKHINHIFLLLNKLVQGGYEVNLDWYYLEDDEDMKEVGEDLCSFYQIPYQMCLM